MDEYQMEFVTGLGESYQNCPACGKEMIPEHDECFACGVVVGRYQERLKYTTTRSEVGGIEHLDNHQLKDLDKKWKQVVLNYHDSSEHMTFIQLCQKKKALPFAIHQYTELLKINPEDDIASVMRRRALSFLSVNFVTDKLPTKQGIDLSLGLALALKWINWLGFLFSSACIVVGLTVPDARNLIGLGAAFLSLFVALFVYRKF